MVEEKNALRKMVRMRLSALSSQEKELRSAVIVERIKEHLAVSAARVVALYSPLGSEPQIWQLVEELSKVMLVALPRVEGELMNFYCYTPGTMCAGALGVMEPQGGEALHPDEIDVVVVPGVVFTSDGHRMGRGKGYYDRYLSQEGFRGLKLGVCYAQQIVDEIPQESHDVKMDYVIWE